jgi:hypothetical protein
MNQIELIWRVGTLGDQPGIVRDGIDGELIGAALDQPDALVAP